MLRLGLLDFHGRVAIGSAVSLIGCEK